MHSNTHTRGVLIKRTYNVDEIASILEISKSSAYELVKKGHFRTVKIGTTIRISKNSFDEWLDSHNELMEGDVNNGVDY